MTLPLATGRSATLRGIAVFLAAILAFAVMDTLIKTVSARYGTWQIMLFRSGFALLPILWLVAREGGVSALRTRRLSGHVGRALVGVGAVFCFFYSFAHLPLADVYAISFAAPLIITALATPLLGETVGWRRWAAVLVGFAGVMIMLRPGTGVVNPVALIALAGAGFYALTAIFMRRLSLTETNAAITFYFMVTTTLVGGVMTAVTGWRPPPPPDLLLLALIGIVGGIALILMTQAFRLASPAVLAPFEYSGILWATGFGWAVFGDVPDRFILTGSAVVIGAGLYILHRETLRAQAGG